MRGEDHDARFYTQLQSSEMIDAILLDASDLVRQIVLQIESNILFCKNVSFSARENLRESDETT